MPVLQTEGLDTSTKGHFHFQKFPFHPQYTVKSSRAWSLNSTNVYELADEGIFKLKKKKKVTSQYK